MENNLLENLLKLLLAGGSLTAGAFLAALRAKLASTKQKNLLHLGFYILSGIVIVGVLITMYLFCKGCLSRPDWYSITVMAFATISSLLLIWWTYKFLAGKHQYTTKELNPIVNAFSKNADKGNIKLLAGNLDFFGKSIKEIDLHPQYICLKEEAFRQIQILCTEPNSNDEKMRYGKIITDFSTVQLRYYMPLSADLNVRGRIKTLNNIVMLLIYKKVKSGIYEAIPLDTAETEGAHYNHLWNLIWELAYVPTQEQLDEYRNIYQLFNR